MVPAVVGFGDAVRVQPHQLGDVVLGVETRSGRRVSVGWAVITGGDQRAGE